MAVQQAFELRAVKREVQRRRIDKGVVFSHGLHGLGMLGAEQAVQRLAQQRFGCVVEQRGDVGAGLDDLALPRLDTPELWACRP